MERTLGSLKGHVKNRARLEASIARGYLMEETMGYITSYMEGYDTVRRHVWDANPEDGDDYEVLEGAVSDMVLSKKLRNEAHLFVLRNNTLMQPYYE